MRLNELFTQALLVGVGATSAIERRWTNGDNATGSTDPNVTNDCTYWANDIADGDTCPSIAAYYDITESELIAWNPELQPDFCVLITGWSYCVAGPPVAATTSKATVTTSFATPAGTITYSGTVAPVQSGISLSCTEYYLVAEGDTCYTIQDHFLSSGCKGLTVGDFVCVAAETESPTSTQSTTSAFPTQTGVVTNLFYSEHSTNGAFSKIGDKWFYVVEDTKCQTILDNYGLSQEQFYAWNPATGPTCDNLWLDTYVCVGVSSGDSSSPSSTTAAVTSATKTTTTSSTATTTTTSTTSTAEGSAPTPIQVGTPADCVTYYQASSGDSCWAITNEKYTYLTQSQLVTWNPGLGSSCNVLLGYYYCVAVSDAQPMPGTIDSCKAWHHVESGDGCWAIEQQYDITAAQFNQWNPRVGADCAGLWLGYFVCVGV
ncbi:LysM peptidoglycan-binding domain-containing protein [Aspergillus stella-maris]|uniref:LysM peptidoglycan-binding domain-containing protein n=1 Tax=Aspergillus stella-maris TaxID=1810926 RepID=UPI003CCDA147